VIFVTKNDCFFHVLNNDEMLALTDTDIIKRSIAMKKRFLICLMLVLSVSFVFAQGNTESAQKSGDVTLRFSWWGGDSRHEAYMAAANRYMELHPNVHIICEYSGWDGYKEKLYTQLAGGNAPQLFQNHYTWLGEQSNWSGEKDVVKDLSQYKDLIDWSIYPEGLLESNVIYNGKTLALPGSLNANAIVANKAVLDKIGFDYNQNWTFDGFFKFSQQLKAIDPNLYFENGMSATDIHIFWFLAYLVQKTGLPFATDYVLNYSVSDLTEAFTFLQKYFTAGVTEPLGTLELYSGNYSQNPKWVSGESGILFGMLSTIDTYVNALGDYKDQATVIRLPVMEGSKNPYYQVKVGQIFSVAASATDKEAEEAVKFLNWMNTDEEAGVLLKLSRGIPISQAQNDALSKAGLMNPMVVQAYQYAKDAGSGLGEGPGALIRNNEISSIGSDLISKVAFNMMSPEDAAKEYSSLVNSKLKDIKVAQTK
jgi:oligogalacturonide transport system substrate-binding protein